MYSKNKVDEFVELLPELEAVQALGLAKILKVPLSTGTERDEEGKLIPRESQEIIEEIIVRFARLGRKQKKEIIAAMRDTIRENKKDK